MTEKRTFTLEKLLELRGRPCCQIRPPGIPSTCALWSDTNVDKCIISSEKDIVLCPPRKSFPSAQENKEYNKNEVFTVNSGKTRWDYVIGGRSNNTAIADRDKAGPRPQRQQPVSNAAQRFHKDTEGRVGAHPRPEGSNWATNAASRDEDPYRFSTGDPLKDREFAQQREKIPHRGWDEVARPPPADVTAQDNKPANKWISVKDKDDADRKASLLQAQVASHEPVDVDSWFSKVNMNSILLEDELDRGNGMRTSPQSTRSLDIVGGLTHSNQNAVSGTVEASRAFPKAVTAGEAAARSRFSTWFSLTDDGLPSQNPHAAQLASSAAGPVTMSALQAIAPVTNNQGASPKAASTFSSQDFDRGNAQFARQTQDNRSWDAFVPPAMHVANAQPQPPPTYASAAASSSYVAPPPPVFIPSPPRPSYGNGPLMQSALLPRQNPSGLCFPQSLQPQASPGSSSSMGLPASSLNSVQAQYVQSQTALQTSQAGLKGYYRPGPTDSQLQSIFFGGSTAQQAAQLPAAASGGPAAPTQPVSSISDYQSSPPQTRYHMEWGQSYTPVGAPILNQPHSPPLVLKGFVVDQRGPLASKISQNASRQLPPSMMYPYMPPDARPTSIDVPRLQAQQQQTSGSTIAPTYASVSAQSRPFIADAKAGANEVPKTGFDLSTLMHLVGNRTPMPVVKSNSQHPAMVTAEDFEKKMGNSAFKKP